MPPALAAALKHELVCKLGQTVLVDDILRPCQQVYAVLSCGIEKTRPNYTASTPPEVDPAGATAVKLVSPFPVVVWRVPTLHGIVEVDLSTGALGRLVPARELPEFAT